LTHVGNLITVKGNQRRFAPTPAQFERNHLPTSPEYAVATVGVITEVLRARLSDPWRISFRLPIATGVAEGATNTSDPSKTYRATGRSDYLCVATPCRICRVKGAWRSRRSFLLAGYHKSIWLRQIAGFERCHRGAGLDPNSGRVFNERPSKRDRQQIRILRGPATNSAQKHISCLALDDYARGGEFLSRNCMSHHRSARTCLSAITSAI